ncbi:MAG: AAA family ATPase [Burkholderiaceae bacterium]
MHLANGGYLMVDAWRLFSEPRAWDTLKRALQRRAIRIESVAEAAGIIGSTHLEPAPIPLDVKVVLFGERDVLLLAEHDPDFETLFRVVADFDDALPQFLARARPGAVVVEQAAANGLAPLEPPALARLLDEAVRLAEDNTRFSAHVQTLVELAVEADYQARRADCAAIGVGHIRQAIAHIVAIA